MAWNVSQAHSISLFNLLAIKHLLGNGMYSAKVKSSHNKLVKIRLQPHIKVACKSSFL